ncbi:MAG: lamin tail domain-containing protein, partial [Bacteroidetes bacterium]|nr:lamin tail domain-containing protein [Bacteroidota bacterium]
MRKLFTLAIGMLVAFASFAQTDCSDLYFSEYIEGSSSNKALEIYNPSSSDINLTGYAVALFSNGSTSPSNVLYLKGTLASGDVYTIVNASASSTLLALADTTSSVTNFNGNDAVVLGDAVNLIPIDVIGQVGSSSVWTVGSGSTQDYTLVRMAKIKVGETSWTNGASQWDVYSKDEFTYFGSHTSDCISSNSGPKTIKIAELRKLDTLGQSIYHGQTVWTSGVVNSSVSFSTSRTHISLQDSGWGISTFLSNWNYTPKVGDSISILAEIGNFAGLAQFTGTPDSFIVHSSGAAPKEEIVTGLDESTESKLIRINRVWMIDSNDWKGSGSNMDVNITNGTDTFLMRVDKETNVDGYSLPNGMFDVIGVGGQYDASAPHNTGYQILPRSITDLNIDNYHVPISDIRKNDAMEESLLNGRKITTYGIVNTNVNLNSRGLQISIQDQNHAVTIYASSSDLG